jgi:general secretion pathway protein E
MKVIAEMLGFPFMRLDSLELDADFITRTLPHKFADRNLIIPLSEEDGRIRVAVFDPSQTEVLQDVARVTGKSLDAVMAPKSDIMRIILEFHGFKGSIKAAAEHHVKYFKDLSDLERLSELKSIEEITAAEKNIRTAVDATFRRALSERASDIHIEPKRTKSLIRMRIDGVLHDINWMPAALHSSFVSRIKSMGNMDIAEKRRPQDGRIKLNTKTREVEVRVSTVPTVFGEKAVLRVQDPDLLFMDLKDLGFTGHDYPLFLNAIKRPFGIILVTGPTGSGKTTTLYSALRDLATSETNVTSIEDPIEMVSERFNQIAVNPAVSMLHNQDERMTFGPMLRHVMRQDPDVIMIGEIRDEETASLAVQAALTGHLVFSTVHTNDAMSSIGRLLDLKVPAFLLANTLICLIAQRLLRLVCEKCAQKYTIPVKELNKMGFNFEGPEVVELQRGTKCFQCRDTGYYKRESVFEIVAVDEQMSKLIVENPDVVGLKEYVRRRKFKTLWENAILKMLAGKTTPEEVLRVAQPDPHFREPFHLERDMERYEVFG